MPVSRPKVLVGCGDVSNLVSRLALPYPKYTDKKYKGSSIHSKNKFAKMSHEVISRTILYKDIANCPG
jgi:hypothetical protein